MFSRRPELSTGELKESVTVSSRILSNSTEFYATQLTGQVVYQSSRQS